MMKFQDDTNSAKFKIANAARRLFAERSIDGVTTRQITKAAEQKNQASLAYYFGTKENLVKELLLDATGILDHHRRIALDNLEAQNKPVSVREITTLLMKAADRVSEDNPDGAGSHMRFIGLISRTHPDLFMNTLNDKDTHTYRRCMDHLRRLMPNMPTVIKTQRLAIFSSYLAVSMANREEALEAIKNGTGHEIWAPNAALAHYAQMMEAMLIAPYEADLFAGTDLKKAQSTEYYRGILGSGSSQTPSKST
ncbi:MAG: TetR/AcrR family transcriptional regulator [Parvibaculaceae bacterium]|nr:TetR/AcrR family transcriptional regulator [Parvibaculaceae bacterium]